MYPNLYCKRKYYENNNYHTFPIMLAANAAPNTLPIMLPVTQKLQPSAPPFEPRKHLQQNDEQLVEEQAKDQNINNIEQPATQINNVLPYVTAPIPNETMLHSVPLMPAGSIPVMQMGPINGVNEAVNVGYHPLQHIWTLWYLETDRSKTWEEMQNEISSVDNVEDFWRLYNHIKPASEIKPGCDYSLFKRGIRPMWEDEANREGGRWILNLPRGLVKSQLDSIWLDVLLSLIGESFEHSDQICGAVVNVRSKTNKISVWTTNGQNSAAILEIGCKLRDILRLSSQQLHYQLHKDTMSKMGSAVKSIYII